MPKQKKYDELSSRCLLFLSLVNSDGCVRGNEDWYADLLLQLPEKWRQEFFVIVRLAERFIAYADTVSTLLSAKGIQPTRLPESMQENPTEIWQEKPNAVFVDEWEKRELWTILVDNFSRKFSPWAPRDLSNLASRLEADEGKSWPNVVDDFLACGPPECFLRGAVFDALTLVRRCELSAGQQGELPPLVMRCSYFKCRRLFFVCNERWRYCAFHRKSHNAHKSTTAASARYQRKKGDDAYSYKELRNRVERERYAAKRGRPIRKYVKRRPGPLDEIPYLENLPEETQQHPI